MHFVNFQSQDSIAYYYTLRVNVIIQLLLGRGMRPHYQIPSKLQICRRPTEPSLTRSLTVDNEKMTLQSSTHAAL